MFKVASLTYPLPKSRDLKILIEDPEQGGEEDINFSPDDYLCFYQDNLIDLTDEIQIMSEKSGEYSYKIVDGMIDATAQIDDVSYRVQISEETKRWVKEYKKFKEKGSITEKVFIEKIE